MPITSADNFELLARLDERTDQVLARLKELQSTLEENYVTKHEFQPVRMIAFGLAALILVAVVTNIVSLAFGV